MTEHSKRDWDCDYNQLVDENERLLKRVEELEQSRDTAARAQQTIRQNTARIEQALRELAFDMRTNWCEYEGRSAQHHLEELAGFLRPDSPPFSLSEWRIYNGMEAP